VPTKLKNYLLITLVIVFSIGLDQFTKNLAREHLKYSGTVNVVGDVFVLVYAENDGAFLGMGSNIPQPYKTVVLTIFPVLLTLFALGYLILEKNLTLGEMICIASVIGGGMSNLYDRILHQGTVTDFMNFGIGPWLRTGILNTADLSITLGAVALVWLQMYRNKKDPKSI